MGILIDVLLPPLGDRLVFLVMLLWVGGSFRYLSLELSSWVAFLFFWEGSVALRVVVRWWPWLFAEAGWH